MKIAKFDNTKVASVYFENVDVPSQKLAKNPIQTTVGSNTVKVSSYMHGQYDTSSNVQISGITGDRVGSVITLSSPSLDTSGGSPADNTYTNQATTGGTGLGRFSTSYLVIISDNLCDGQFTATISFLSFFISFNRFTKISLLYVFLILLQKTLIYLLMILN